MKPGTKPKPTAIKLLEGNPGRRDLSQSPQPPGGDMRAPAGMPLVARREWRRVVPILVRLGVASQVDRNALADYCLCVARLADAEADIEKRGLLVEGERGQVKNPSCQLAREYRAAVVRWAVEFGLTPSSRSRLSVPEKPEDDLDALLG